MILPMPVVPCRFSSSAMQRDISSSTGLAATAILRAVPDRVPPVVFVMTSSMQVQSVVFSCRHASEFVHVEHI